MVFGLFLCLKINQKKNKLYNQKVQIKFSKEKK
jgi:hypothetical protein